MTLTSPVPVTSSCNISTIPLAEAQAMFPPPRPPSPQSRARAQRARLANSNPNSLTPKDAAVLMSLQKPAVVAPPAKSSARGGNKRGSVAPSALTSSDSNTVSPAISPSLGARTLSRQTSSSSVRPPTITNAGVSASSPEAKLLQWVNTHLPAEVPDATGFSTSFKSGRLILRLLESLSGEKRGIPDSRFGASSTGSADSDQDAHVRRRRDLESS